VFGIANGFYDFDNEVPRWTHIGLAICAVRVPLGLGLVGNVSTSFDLGLSLSFDNLLPVQLVRASFDRSFDNI
jgi:hypothetical protein